MPISTKSYAIISIIIIFSTIIGVFLGTVIVSNVNSPSFELSETNLELDSESENDSTPMTEMQDHTNYTKTIDNSLDSVSSIYVENDDVLQSQGSGFMYTDNHIMTNEHVTEGGESIHINYNTGDWTKAHIVGEDEYTDIAILEPEYVPDEAIPLPMQDELPNRGTSVLALGSPNDLDGTATSGIISGLQRPTDTESAFSIPDSIQTDAALNQGNSGGPLVSEDNGKVVGVNRATDGENIGFAVSARLADTVGQSILDDGEHNHPYLGVVTYDYAPISTELDDVGISDGLIISETIQDSPSEDILKSELDEEVPDIIVSVDNKNVKTNEELTSYLMLNKEPGDSIELEIYRNGDFVTEDITLTSR